MIRNFDPIHAKLFLIAPQLRYSLPEMPGSQLHLDLSSFIDAWILEEHTRTYDWSLLVTTAEQLIRIVSFTSEHAMLQHMEADSRLERVFVGRGLTQISSVNSYS